MSDRLKEIAERAEKATPGPWTKWCFDEGIGWSVVCKRDDPDPDMVVADLEFDSTIEDQEPNAEFIAHAREDIPFLLSVVAQLQRIIDDPELYALEQRAKGYRADGGDR